MRIARIVPDFGETYTLGRAEFPADDDLLLLIGDPLVRVVDGDLNRSGLGAMARGLVQETGPLPRTQGLGLEDEVEGGEEVGFSRSVPSDNDIEVGMERKGGGRVKGLEALDLEVGDVHCDRQNPRSRSAKLDYSAIRRPQERSRNSESEI